MQPPFLYYYDCDYLIDILQIKLVNVPFENKVSKNDCLYCGDSEKGDDDDENDSLFDKIIGRNSSFNKI